MEAMTNTQLIQSIYLGLLGRPAETDGLRFWTNILNSGQMTIDQIRENFVNNQPEYLNGQGAMSRADAVRDLYKNLYQREPDADGFEYWVNGEGAQIPMDQLVLAMTNPLGAGQEDLQVLFNKTTLANQISPMLDYLSVAEFADVLNSVSATEESLDAALAAVKAKEIPASDLIQQLYIGLLGRAAEADGLAFWSELLESGQMTLFEIRENFVNNQPEYINGQGAMSRADAVRDLYKNLFQREPDAEGFEYWVNGEGANVPFDLLVLAIMTPSAAAESDRSVLNQKVNAAHEFANGNANGKTAQDIIILNNGEPPVTQPPVTQPPATEPPVTQPPATEPPVTQPPATEPPVTQPPVVTPPVEDPEFTANLDDQGNLTFANVVLGPITLIYEITEQQGAVFHVEHNGERYDDTFPVALVKNVIAPNEDTTISIQGDIDINPQSVTEGEKLLIGASVRAIDVDGKLYYVPADITETGAFAIKNASDVFVGGDVEGSVKSGFEIYSTGSLKDITQQSALDWNVETAETHTFVYGMTLGAGNGADTLKLLGINHNDIIDAFMGISTTGYKDIFLSKTYVNIMLIIQTDNPEVTKSILLMDVIATDVVIMAPDITVQDAISAQLPDNIVTEQIIHLLVNSGNLTFGDIPAAPEPTTFTVELNDEGVLAFDGTAEGVISFTVSPEGVATFSREGVDATLTPNVTDITSAGEDTIIYLNDHANNLSVADARALLSIDGLDTQGFGFTLLDSLENIYLDTLSKSESELTEQGQALLVDINIQYDFYMNDLENHMDDPEYHEYYQQQIQLWYEYEKALIYQEYGIPDSIISQASAYTFTDEEGTNLGELNNLDIALLIERAVNSDDYSYTIKTTFGVSNGVNYTEEFPNATSVELSSDGSNAFIIGSSGDDVFSIDSGAGHRAENSTLNGGDGHDRLHFWSGHSGGHVEVFDDAFANATNFEEVSLSSSSGNNILQLGAFASETFSNHGITINTLPNQNIALDAAMFTQLMTVTGGNGTNSFIGGSRGNEFFTGTGTNTITTGLGSDIVNLSNGAGEDTIIIKMGTTEDIKQTASLVGLDLSGIKLGDTLTLTIAGRNEPVVLVYNGYTFSSDGSNGDVFTSITSNFDAQNDYQNSDIFVSIRGDVPFVIENARVDIASRDGEVSPIEMMNVTGRYFVYIGDAINLNVYGESLDALLSFGIWDAGSGTYVTINRNNQDETLTLADLMENGEITINGFRFYIDIDPNDPMNTGLFIEYASPFEVESILIEEPGEVPNQLIIDGPLQSTGDFMADQSELFDLSNTLDGDTITLTVVGLAEPIVMTKQDGIWGYTQDQGFSVRVFDFIPETTAINVRSTSDFEIASIAVIRQEYAGREINISETIQSQDDTFITPIAYSSIGSMDSIVNFQMNGQDKLFFDTSSAPITDQDSLEGGIVSIINGVITFAEDVGGELHDKVEAAFNYLHFNHIALFHHDDNTYVIRQNHESGIQNSDIIVELVGVTVTNLNTIMTDSLFVPV